MKDDDRSVLDVLLSLASRYSQLPEDAPRRGIFEVGLSSLDVLELVDDCVQKGIPLTVDDLLDLPTLDDVAQRVEGRGWGPAPRR